MEWVVKNTRTMEASIVVIAFQKEIVKMVKVKVEVERFDFITNPMLLTSAGREREGEGGSQICPYPVQTNAPRNKNVNDNISYILICILALNVIPCRKVAQNTQILTILSYNSGSRPQKSPIIAKKRITQSLYLY